jgi:hypothetical protein
VGPVGLEVVERRPSWPRQWISGDADYGGIEAGEQAARDLVWPEDDNNVGNKLLQRHPQSARIVASAEVDETRCHAPGGRVQRSDPEESPLADEGHADRAAIRRHRIGQLSASDERHRRLP